MSSSGPIPSPELSEPLMRLTRLFESGALTEAEFLAEKDRLLTSMPGATVAEAALSSSVEPPKKPVGITAKVTASTAGELNKKNSNILRICLAAAILGAGGIGWVLTSNPDVFATKRDRAPTQLREETAPSSSYVRPPAHLPKRIPDIANYDLFNTVTGEPQVWYWRSENGEYEFFDGEGFHPGSGIQLKSFDAAAISKWRKEVELAKDYEKQELQRAQEQEQLKRDAEERRVEQERSLQESRKHQEEESQRQEEQRQKIAMEAAERCDQFAANPHDLRKSPNVVGVRFGDLKLNYESAVAACQSAREQFPSELRFSYQYARAIGLTKPDEAASMYRTLIQRKYIAAYDNLGSLLVQRNDQKAIKSAIQIFKEGARNGDPDSMVSLASWVGTNYFPVANPYAYKLALLKEAAKLGHEGAAEAVDEAERQVQQQQQEYATQKQQEQMMLDLFGNIVGGIVRGR
jgi:hypothetical protein